jgi:deoxyhypusine synthase
MASTERKDAAPLSVTEAVLKPSEEMPAGSQKVEELDFNAFAGRKVTVEDLISGMNYMGFQASSIGEAVRIINDMVCVILRGGICSRTFSSLFHLCR